MRIEAQRIMVIGTSCAGKTTFARALGERLGLPHVELDALYWGPNWTPRGNFLELAAEAAGRERWIMDGNYRATRDLLWPQAQLIVWLDYEMGVVVARALRRTLKRSWEKSELWAGNRESFRKQLASRDSILLWVLTTWRRRRHDYARQFAATGAYGGTRVLRFRAPQGAERFLATVTSDPSR